MILSSENQEKCPHQKNDPSVGWRQSLLYVKNRASNRKASFFFFFVRTRVWGRSWPIIRNAAGSFFFILSLHSCLALAYHLVKNTWGDDNKWNGGCVRCVCVMCGLSFHLLIYFLDAGSPHLSVGIYIYINAGPYIYGSAEETDVGVREQGVCVFFAKLRLSSLEDEKIPMYYPSPSTIQRGDLSTVRGSISIPVLS